MRTKLISVSKFSRKEKREKEKRRSCRVVLVSSPVWRVRSGVRALPSDPGACLKGAERKSSCVLGGALSALIASVLLTGAAPLVYSSRDFAVTFIQSVPAAASPQEAQRRPRTDKRWPTERRASPVWVGRRSLLGKFCCLGRKASAGGSGGRTVVLRAGWAFSTSPPFQETHFVVSSPCVCQRREGGERRATGLGARATSKYRTAHVCSFKKSF